MLHWQALCSGCSTLQLLHHFLLPLQYIRTSFRNPMSRRPLQKLSKSLFREDILRRFCEGNANHIREKLLARRCDAAVLSYSQSQFLRTVPFFVGDFCQSILPMVRKMPQTFRNATVHILNELRCMSDSAIASNVVCSRIKSNAVLGRACTQCSDSPS